MHEREKWKWSHWVVSNSQRPHGLQPTRLLHPWDFPGKSTGAGASAFSTCLSTIFCIGFNLAALGLSLWQCGTFELWKAGSLAVASEHSVAAYGIKFSDQRLNRGYLCLEHGVLALNHQGSTFNVFTFVCWDPIQLIILYFFLIHLRVSFK